MENPKCIKGNNAISICVSGSCEKPNPFSCVQCVNSQCKAAHQDCIFLQWASFKTKLQKSQKLTNPDFINFSNTVEQTIRKSIQHLQKQLDNFYIWKSKFGLIPEAVALLKSIKENQQSAFTGKQISKILLNINIELPKFNEKELNIQVKQVLGKAGQLQKMIKQLYSFSVFNKKPVEEAICITKQEPKKLEILPSEQPIKIIKLPPPKPVQQISLKMKEKYLTNLNQKLSVLYEKPSHLELKFNYSHWWDSAGSDCAALEKMSRALSGVSYKYLKTLTIYYPWTLGADQGYMEGENMLASTLNNLQDFQLLTIIAMGIKSLQGLKLIRNKIKVSAEKDWASKQNW